LNNLLRRCRTIAGIVLESGFVHKTPLCRLIFLLREKVVEQGRALGKNAVKNSFGQCGSTEVHYGRIAGMQSSGKDHQLPKKRQDKTLVKPTKTTACIPADLYGQMWHLIACERSAGRKLTAQAIMVEALREYLEARKKGAAA
jgi:hypothetical protein